jgi:hypothetical protein
MTTRHVESSWLTAISYVPVARELKHTLPSGMDGFLIARTRTGRKLVWCVPAWVCGLLMAHPSKGRALNFVKNGKWPAVPVPVSQQEH